MSFTRLAGLSLLAFALSTLASASASTVTFSYHEALGREWVHEVLNFRVKVPKLDCDLATMYVTDESGAVVSSQVADPEYQAERPEIPVTVTVLTNFAPREERRWTLHCGEQARREPPGTDLKATEEPDAYVLSNSLITIRTGRGEKRFPAAVPADKVAAPLQAVRGPSGKWLGRGWIESTQKVSGYRIALTHDGPLYKRVKAEYWFEQGWYTCYLTLRTGEEVVHVREEFDLGEPSPDRTDNFCFSLYQGLQPDTVRWFGRTYDKEFDPAGAALGTQEAVFPIDYGKAQRLLRLHGLFVWWPQAAQYYGAYRADDPQSDLVALFPERPGHWRNPTVLFLETAKGPDLVVKAPIRQPVQDWVTDGVDYLSPYYTGTVYPGTPRNLGVREWGMLVTRADQVLPANDDFTQSGIRKAWTKYGQNPLDKIKDWTLEWPDPGPEAYPRGAITRAELPALRERAARVPELKALVGSAQHLPFTYLVNQDRAIGDKLVRNEAGGDTNWMGILPKLRASVGYYLDREGDMGIHTFMHHGIGNVGGAAPLFDVAMSVPEMSPEERREARALYAFCMYKLSDPDWLAYGAGFHLGNPNMPTTAMSTLGSAAALIPEHPRAYDWMLSSVSSTLNMLRDYTAPGGAWRECPHYQMDASNRFVLASARVFRNAGFMDLYQNPFLKSTILYHAQIITPVDPRFGIRMMPTLGNTGYENTSVYAEMAAGTAQSDPDYAAGLMWAWQQMGKPYLYPNDEYVIDDALPAKRPDLSSRHFPGFGTVMRARVGEPDEAYLIFRFGYQHEHYENEQGEIVFWAKGVPLVQDFGSLYQPMMLRPWFHNRVSFNHKLDWLNRGEVVENNLLESADACLGRMTVDQVLPYPEEPGTPTPPNAGPPAEPIKPTTWTRQLVFVKPTEPDGPTYVVLRDGFAGAGDDFSEFSLWDLAKEVKTEGNVANFPGQLGVDLAVTVLDPPQPQFTTGSYGHKFAYLGGQYWNKVHGGKVPFEETQCFLRLKRTDHEGYFAVLYPHRPEEPAPVFTAWGGGVGVTATVGGEKHVVICAPQAGKYAGEGITLEGQRALVRQGAERTILALLQGTRLAAAGYDLAAPGPVEITAQGKEIAGEANLPAAGEVVLTLPAGTMATVVVITVNGQDQPVTPVAGQPVRLALPAGRATFRVTL
jgi:hypothetical protein